MSTDDGRSAWVENQALQEVLLRGDLVSGSRLGDLSASALGVLSESRGIEPRVGSGDRSPEEMAAAMTIEWPDGELAALLRQRVTERRIGPIDVTELVKLLIVCDGVLAQESAPDGFPITHRAVPSAGARHPISLVVAANRVIGLESGLYRFNSWSGELEPRDMGADDSNVVPEVRDKAHLEGEVGAVVFLVSDFSRTLSRYARGATFAWLDAGALAFHLVAFDRGLASCIVGTSGLIDVATRDRPIQDLVAVAVGNRPLPK